MEKPILTLLTVFLLSSGCLDKSPSTANNTNGQDNSDPSGGSLKCKVGDVVKDFSQQITTSITTSPYAMTRIRGCADSDCNEWFSLEFQAVGVGLYYDNHNGVPHFKYRDANTTLYASNMTGVFNDDSTQIEVTSYGSVGEKIEGVFFTTVGDGNYTDGPAELRVTGGIFSVIRPKDGGS